MGSLRGTLVFAVLVNELDCCEIDGRVSLVQPPAIHGQRVADDEGRIR